MNILKSIACCLALTACDRPDFTPLVPPVRDDEVCRAIGVVDGPTGEQLVQATVIAAKGGVSGVALQIIDPSLEQPASSYGFDLDGDGEMEAWTLNARNDIEEVLSPKAAELRGIVDVAESVQKLCEE